jgi:hypothetical protein
MREEAGAPADAEGGTMSDDEERPPRPMMLILVLFPFVIGLLVLLILRWVSG